MDDFKKPPFGYLKATTTTTTHLGLSQMLVSKEEEEEEKRKQMKIKFECCSDEQQQSSQQQQQLKNHQKMEMKVFQRKIKRRASSSSMIDVTVVEEGNSSNDFSTCPVCFKFFRNKKALFGHMRAHPERQWRGIQPPPPPPPPPSPLKVMKKKKKKKNSSSSSYSTVSDSLVMSMDEQIDSASTSGRLLGFDVLGSISNWPGTVKRRRNVAVSDHRVLDAIDGLLMLVHGGNSMETEDHGKMYMDLLLSKNEKLEVIEEASERSKKRRIEESEDEESMNKWKKVKVYHRNGGDLRSGFVPELMKMECRDQIPVISNGGNNGFKCGTCNKSFPTYQALGGHKSRNSCRNTTTTTTTTTFQPDYHHQFKNNISCPNLIKVDIELKEFNDTRQKDVDYKHKCKVCGKTFLTGQALGGHQGRHQRNSMNGAASSSVSSMTLPQMNNVETPSESVASLEDPGKTSIKLLEFDLNELPPVDYDEECLSQLVPPVFGLTA